MVYYIRKQNNKILQFSEKNVPKEMLKRKSTHQGKNGTVLNVDRFHLRRNEETPISGAILIAQARAYYQESNISEICEYYQPSLHLFNYQHRILEIKVHEKKLSVYVEAAENIAEDFFEFVVRKDITF